MVKGSIQNVMILLHINNDSVENIVAYSLKYLVRIKKYEVLKINFFNAMALLRYILKWECRNTMWTEKEITLF